MTREELAAIKARCEKATPGPWSFRSHAPSQWEIWTGTYCLSQLLGLSDADFIAHAREDVPALVEEVENLRRLLADALPYLESHEDEGPPDEGWKSDRLAQIVDGVRGVVAPECTEENK